MNLGLVQTAGLRTLIVVGSLSMMTTYGCSGSGPEMLGPPTPPDEPLGGLWVGTSDDREIFVFSTDGGGFRWIDWDSGEQGLRVVVDPSDVGQ